MIGLYSLDLIIGADNQPTLIEINGSNSGFEGFAVAYGDGYIQAALAAGFRRLTGDQPIHVVTRLVSFGDLPPGYLRKVTQDQLYSRYADHSVAPLLAGLVGSTWNRLKAPPPSAKLRALDGLIAADDRFQQVLLNVDDPRYVVPLAPFSDNVDSGILEFKPDAPADVAAIPLTSASVLWLRCPPLAFAPPVPHGRLINPDFPYAAFSDNKLFTYDLLAPVLGDQLPLSLPIGQRCSAAAAVTDLLARTPSDWFIRKPLLGSQARGIEILHRAAIADYGRRLAALEAREQVAPRSDGLPLELRAVPDLLATWTLSFDVSLLSVLQESRPVPCRATGRAHYACMRALTLIDTASDGRSAVHFLGAYWRLAQIPADGDGMLWERYVGSQSQGAFCEPVNDADLAVAAAFVGRVLPAYCTRLAGLPTDQSAFAAWETAYWSARYKAQVPMLRSPRGWEVFEAELRRATDDAAAVQAAADQAGFLHTPAQFLTPSQAARLPYLVREPARITGI